MAAVVGVEIAAEVDEDDEGCTVVIPLPDGNVDVDGSGEEEDGSDDDASTPFPPSVTIPPSFP